jgi:hypothetical protein
MKKLMLVLAAACLSATPHAALASDDGIAVKIRPDIASVEVQTPDGPVTIERIQDTENEITGYFAKTSRKCPSFCIQPMLAAEGVATIGELELLDMLTHADAVVVAQKNA